MKKILILGGGFGGLASADHLVKSLGRDAEITVIDKNRFTEYRPSYLYVMTGYREPDQVRAPLDLLEKRGVRFVNAEVKTIDPGNRIVKTSAGDFNYDYLIISLGAVTRPDLVKGGSAPSPWELDLALETRKSLLGFRRGKIVVAVHSLPYRCPPAPWEVAFLLDFYFSGLGVRRDVEITMVHPYTRPFENFGPLAAKMMENMMSERRINWVGVGREQAVEEIDQSKKILVTTKGDKISYDLLILVPPHTPPEAVAKSDIADPKTGWAQARIPTFRTKYDDVYAIGDIVAPSIGLGMAGVIMHSYLKYVTEAIVSDIKGVYIGSDFRIFASCVLDVGGFGMAAACDFTKCVLRESQYPDCIFLPPTGISRVFKEWFEKLYFTWLLGYYPR